MRLRQIFDVAQVQAAMGQGAAAIPAARQALLRNLGIQAVRTATRLAGGPGTAKPGSYPIPIRTGTLRRGMNFEVQDNVAIVFNDTVYARAAHQGFQPYGNPRAHAIPGRPFFGDAIEQLDLQAAADAWTQQTGAQ
jgi:phage gpG-like protein